jgi:hypothetical protein
LDPRPHSHAFPFSFSLCHVEGQDWASLSNGHNLKLQMPFLWSKLWLNLFKSTCLGFIYLFTCLCL